MSDFDESEHPRDEDGRFTFKDMANAAVLVGHTDFLKLSDKEKLQVIKNAREQGKDSQKLHTNPETGQFTKERQEIHEAAINKFLGKGTSNEKTVYMLGGAPANGKSTVENSGFLNMPDLDLVNADELKAELPEYKALTKIKDRDGATFVHEESSYMSKVLMDRIMKSGKGMILDGVNDGGYDKLLKKIDTYKSHGNKIVANYVSLDTEQSLVNAELRGRKNGRFVPLNVLLENNSEVSKLVPKLVADKVFDDFSLWDTNTNGKPLLVLSQKKGVTTMHDQAAYDRFLSKANYVYDENSYNKKLKEAEEREKAKKK